VVQEMRIGISCLNRIEESKTYRPFRGRGIDGRKNSSDNFALRAVHCLRKRSLVKLSANNPRAVADSRWWSKAVLPVSSARVLKLFAFAAVACPWHRFQTGLRDRLLADLTHPVDTLSDPSECLFDCS
jgi:hypothetical protein